MRVVILLAGILSLGVMSNISAQVIYKWVDGEGVTHFSEQPPLGIKAERTAITLHQTNRRQLQARIDTAAQQNVAVATRKQQGQEQAAEDKTRTRNDEELRAEYCDKAKARLVTYNTSRRLYRPLENGEREYLTDDELDSERVAAQKLVDEWCD